MKNELNLTPEQIEKAKVSDTELDNVFGGNMGEYNYPLCPLCNSSFNVEDAEDGKCYCNGCKHSFARK